MNKHILKTGAQRYISENWNADIMSALLKPPIFEGISQRELAEQLEAKKKCLQKLPTWFNAPKIYYPNKFHIEQASSEATALYKSQLVKGKTLADISGGLGVDACYFAQKMGAVHYCETNSELVSIAEHNFGQLQQKNIKCALKDGLLFLKESQMEFDWIYVDPSRRNDLKRKVFILRDCRPNVTVHLSFLMEKAPRLLIKTSPILDISSALRELGPTREIHVVAVDNEVKEVLYILERAFTGDSMFTAVDISKKETGTFVFSKTEERNTAAAYAHPQHYLYEPHAAILKSGGFKTVGQRSGTKKLHVHSHLYTSEVLVDFPGRRFRVQATLPYSKNALKRLRDTKANITVRNFPLSVTGIREKHKIKDGGDTYLFFTTDLNNDRIVLICEKV